MLRLNNESAIFSWEKMTGQVAFGIDSERSVSLRSEATKNLRFRWSENQTRHRRDWFRPVAQNDKVEEIWSSH